MSASILEPLEPTGPVMSSSSTLSSLPVPVPTPGVTCDPARCPLAGSSGPSALVRGVAAGEDPVLLPLAVEAVRIRRSRLRAVTWNGPDRTGSRTRTRSQQGITTAEYAVGTAAGAGLAGLLYKMLTGGFGQHLLQTLFDHVLALLGIG